MSSDIGGKVRRCEKNKGVAETPFHRFLGVQFYYVINQIKQLTSRQVLPVTANNRGKPFDHGWNHGMKNRPPQSQIGL